jgi:Tfp pilus assembly protein PilN
MAELIEINLLPIEDRKIKKDYTYLLDTKVVIPTLALIFSGILYVFGKKTIDFRIEDKNKEITSIKEQIKVNRKTLKDLKKLEQLLKEKNAKNRSLQSISFNKQLWVRILEGISKTLPSNSWIKKITQDKETQDNLVITGATHLFSEVATYMIDLESDDYFLKVDLEKIEVDNTSDAFIFDLRIKLNLNLGAQSPVIQDTLVSL